MNKFLGGSARAADHPLAFLTTRLVFGNTTVGFCLGGSLAAALILVSDLIGPVGGVAASIMIISLAVSGGLAAFCSGLGNLAGAGFGVSFAFPGVAVALLLRPQTLHGLTTDTVPWGMIVMCSVTFVLSFGLAGGFGALLARQGTRWVIRSALGLGLGGLAGGTLLALLLIAMHRVEAPVTSYLASVCLATLVAFVVGGSQLDAERRRSLRIRAVLPFSFSVVHSEENTPVDQNKLSCRTQNISLGGFNFESEVPLSGGDILSIELPLGEEHQLQTFGKVVWDKVEQDDRRSVGVEFLQLQETDQKELIQYYLDLERANHSRHGFVLVSSMLIVLLLGGISVGTFYMVNTENRLGASDTQNMRVYYAAEAAMEKMMSDLSGLYSQQMSPTVAAIQGLGASGMRPTISGVTFPDYTFDVPVDGGGNPIMEVRQISAGPSEGLLAYIVKMTLRVTSAGPHEAEVRMERDVEVALIPVFQFGMFSESDLSYFPGPGFDFGGRVHSNGNLFLATSATDGLTFFSKITAVNEVIRAELANGLNTVTTGRDEEVWIPTAPGGCNGAKPACRDLDENEGSKVGGPGSGDNSNWSNLSLTDYNGFILNGDTGAKRLNLPFVAPGLRPVEIIRRPPATEDPNSLVARSRLHNMAQLRVVISDTLAEHPGNTGVRLANVAPYYDGVLYGSASTDTAFAEGASTRGSDFHQPSGGGDPWSLIDGYLLVESRRTDGSYVDVTGEWLDLGIARENADAILKFQTLEWDGSNGNPLHANTTGNRRDGLKFLPLGLYDTREGEVRDQNLGASDSCAVGGIMNVVELDVANLKRWLEGTTGTTGTLTESVSQNGYVVYFSDRRGMRPNGGGVKVGEYGYEDIINPGDAAGVPNGTLDAPEDVNQNGTLETYGGANLGDAFGVANNDPTIRVSCNGVGRKNRVSGARHALKLVNGALGNVPTPGFTVASENMVYVTGNFNANDSGFGDPHAATAVIADTASFLSKDWADWRSFQSPTDKDSREAATSYYRIAVLGGKNMNWAHPAWTTAQDYGLDGGTHNFLRYLEDWGGETFWYRGSLVSLYYSEYATGIYKCCEGVYNPPTREYTFDTDFLDLSKLPPGTPRFRDIVNLGYRQIFTPD